MSFFDKTPNGIAPAHAADRATAAIDSAAHVAENALQGTQRLTSQALDKLDSARIDAGALAQRGSDAIRHAADQARDKALHARDATRGYIQDEPMKAVLMAAAAGAVLVLLGSLLTRRGQS